MNRRKFFGAAAGAAVAVRQAPALADYQSIGIPAYGVGDCAGVGGTIAEQIARAKRIAMGDIRGEDKNYATAGPLCPYDPLKSVSAAAKAFMRDRWYEAQWRERTIKKARDMLDHHDKTGIVREFF